MEWFSASFFEFDDYQPHKLSFGGKMRYNAYWNFYRDQESNQHLRQPKGSENYEGYI